jgi:hypothetical protein
LRIHLRIVAGAYVHSAVKSRHGFIAGIFLARFRGLSCSWRCFVFFSNIILRFLLLTLFLARCVSQSLLPLPKALAAPRLSMAHF